MTLTQGKYLAWCVAFALALLAGQVYCPPKSTSSKRAKICETESCRELANTLIENMDASVDPCQDFYQFSCGAARRSQSVIAGSRSINMLEQAIKKMNHRIMQLVKLPIGPQDSVDLVQMKNFFKSCEKREGSGKDDFIWLLERIGGLPLLAEQTGWQDCSSCSDWIHLTQRLRNVGIFFQSFFQSSFKSTEESTIEIMPLDGKLVAKWTMQGREAELKKYAFILLLLAVKTSESIEQQLNEMLQFRMELAEIYSNQADSKLTLSIPELHQLASQIDWVRLIKTFRGKRSPVEKVNTFARIDMVANLIHKTNSRTLINHMIMLSLEKLIGSVISDPQAPHCVRLISNKMPSQMSREYIRRFVTQQTKDLATSLVRGLQRQLVLLLGTFSWLSEDARVMAIIRTKTLSITMINTDEFLEQTENVKIKSDKFLANILELNRALDVYATENNVDGDGHVDFNRMGTRHFAHYHEKSHQLGVFFASMDSVLLNQTRPNYANLALFGALVSHELGNMFNPRNLNSNRRSIGVWWGPFDEFEYRQRTSCLANQVQAIDWPELGFKVDPKKVMCELTADHFALELAYNHYRELERVRTPEPLLPNLDLNQAQLFWLTHATMWCHSMSPQQSLQKFINSPLPPNKMRLNLPLSNLPQFASDFECPLGSPMNPRIKCTIFQ